MFLPNDFLETVFDKIGEHIIGCVLFVLLAWTAWYQYHIGEAPWQVKPNAVITHSNGQKEVKYIRISTVEFPDKGVKCYDIEGKRYCSVGNQELHRQ